MSSIYAKQASYQVDEPFTNIYPVNSYVSLAVTCFDPNGPYKGTIEPVWGWWQGYEGTPFSQIPDTILQDKYGRLLDPNDIVWQNLVKKNSGLDIEVWLQLFEAEIVRRSGLSSSSNSVRQGKVIDGGF